MTFGDPVVHVDEEFYYVVAHAMWHGAVPFVDIWDRKPIGLFLLYMPAARLPLYWGVIAYQVMALASLVATAHLIARMAVRAGLATGATAGAIAYLLWPDLLNGAGGQAPIFYNLPMAGAGVLILAAENRTRPRLWGIAAMSLVGIALQIKYSVVFEGVFFGLWLLWRDWTARRSPRGLIGYGAALVAVALLPTALALAAYWAIGHADAFLFANFDSIGHRNADPLQESLGNIGTLVLVLSPLVAMPFTMRDGVAGGSPVARRFLLLWFAAALFGLAIFGTWFDHYGLPSLVPGTALAAGFFGRPDIRRRIGPAILLVVALLGQTVVAINKVGRGDATQFAELARLVGRGPGGLYVYSGTTMLYPATGRPALSRYVVPAHLNRVREEGAVGIDQVAELRSVMALRPAVVVMRPPFGGERLEQRALVQSLLRAEGYHLAATTPMGQETMSIFKR